MSVGFCGSIVSLDCGDSLGTYQGQVRNINHSLQTLTITKPYRNGLKCEVGTVTLNAGDIKEIKILQSGTAAEAIISKEATPSKLSQEDDSCPSPVKICDIKKNQNGHPLQASGTSCDKPYQERNGYGRHSANGDRYSPRINGHGQRHSPVYMDNRGSYHRYSPPNGESGAQRGGKFTPTKENSQRRNSASASDHSNRGKRATTPRKIEVRKPKPQGRENCFSCPTDSVLGEFDFESNLALFNKKKVFKEMEDENPELVKVEQKNPQKYRHDENVLASKPATLKQIQVDGAKDSSLNYVTDEGLVVPSITYELRNCLFQSAEKLGFKSERIIEMVGRSACEMVLTLIGGSNRLNPKNGHQLPNVVVLCGPHLQGAQGVSCARQLSNHNVKVHLFVPNYTKMTKIMEDELALYDLCDGKRTSVVKELTTGPIDMIINAMDSQENLYLREQTWFKMLEDWCAQSRASVLALDPPLDGGTISAKWCMSIGLPLSLPNNCSHYLCDLGLPKKVFMDVGIKYMSPFSHKFIIPLHPQT